MYIKYEYVIKNHISDLKTYILFSKMTVNICNNNEISILSIINIKYLPKLIKLHQLNILLKLMKIIF